MTSQKEQLDDSTILNNINSASTQAGMFFNDLFNRGTEEAKKRVNNMARWLLIWINYLKSEAQFKPEVLKRYERGEVLWVQLGYNVGTELGGLHLPIVLNRNDSIKKPDITIVPLTSVKDNTDLNNLGDRINLGTEIKDLINDKKIKKQNKLSKAIEEIQNNKFSPRVFKEKLDKINRINRNIKNIDNFMVFLRDESLAHVGKVRCISKMRIMDPKNIDDALVGVVVSKEKMKEIENMVKKLYIVNNP